MRAPLAPLALLALLLACPGSGADAGGSPGTARIGSGAGRLSGPALDAARRAWGDDVCFATVRVAANVHFQCDAPGEHSGALNEFFFQMFSPKRPYDSLLVKYAEPVAVAPVCTVSAIMPALEAFETKIGGSLGAPFDRACLSGLKIDSGEAIAIAVKAGLAAGKAYEASLAEATAPDTGYKSTPQVRGRTFWQVRVQEDAPERSKDTYVVDAKTGKLLLRHKGWLPFHRPGQVGDDR